MQQQNAVHQKNNKFFEEMKIKTMVSSLHNSSANEQAKSTNKEVVQSLKKTLEKDKGKWPEVLWVYQTTPKSSTGETCTFFFFFYCREALILVELVNHA